MMDSIIVPQTIYCVMVGFFRVDVFFAIFVYRIWPQNIHHGKIKYAVIFTVFHNFWEKKIRLELGSGQRSRSQNWICKQYQYPFPVKTLTFDSKRPQSLVKVSRSNFYEEKLNFPASFTWLLFFKPFFLIFPGLYGSQWWCWISNADIFHSVIWRMLWLCWTIHTPGIYMDNT